MLHPYFADLGPVDTNDPRAPGAQPFVDRAVLERMTSDWRVGYQDPLGRAPGGAAYQGAWIAAAQPLRLPGGGAESMMVLVQERSAAATGPVEQLGRHLVGEGLLAVLAIALTVAALWFIVLRGRIGRGDRSARPAPSEPTLAVDPRPLRDRSTLSESGPDRG